MNDIFDMNFDKYHPEKKFRPITSGLISSKKAIFIGSILLLIGSNLIWIVS